jgi:hypothetical protein
VLSEIAERLPNQEALVVRHQNAHITYRQRQSPEIQDPRARDPRAPPRRS